MHRSRPQRKTEGDSEPRLLDYTHALPSTQWLVKTTGLVLCRIEEGSNLPTSNITVSISLFSVQFTQSLFKNSVATTPQPKDSYILGYDAI
jgi:hypothetical protein